MTKLRRMRKFRLNFIIAYICTSLSFTRLNFVISEFYRSWFHTLLNFTALNFVTFTNFIFFSSCVLIQINFVYFAYFHWLFCPYDIEDGLLLKVTEYLPNFNIKSIIFENFHWDYWLRSSLSVIDTLNTNLKKTTFSQFVLILTFLKSTFSVSRLHFVTLM